MDTDDSEAEQSLPVGLDHTGKADVAGDTLLTFQSTTSVDETVPEVPQSPNRRRKRTNEEIYEKSQPPMISTTPAKTPPRDFNLVRATSEPFHNKGSSFPKVGFSALRQEMDAEESDQKVPNTNVNAISHDEAEDSTKAIAFTEQIKLYQQKLEAEFVEFEKGLTTNDQQEIMETLDLNKLEKDYESSMTPLIEEEQRIMQEFQTRLEVSTSVEM